MESGPTISKLVINDKTVYVKIKWIDDECDLVHIEIYGESTWSGTYSKETAEDYRDDESPEQYLETMKSCLTCQNEKFEYELCPGADNTITFSWSKKSENSTMVLQHGSIILQQDSTESKCDLIDFLLNENHQLKQSVKDYVNKTETLSRDLEKCKNELDKLINNQTGMEKNLYGKFMQLLNAKKRRIQTLEDHLKKFDS